ncbi:MAG: hypothetical protein ACYDEN_03750, partial [Acidimicrobiales bacterium]
DISEVRAKHLAIEPNHSRPPPPGPDAARTMSALSVLRDHVVAPILAGVKNPRPGRRPAEWTQIDRDYETLRMGMQSMS